MFHSPAVDYTVSARAVEPTFDALIIGPADIARDGDFDVESGGGNSTPATAFVWRTRAWLPPTRYQRAATSA